MGVIESVGNAISEIPSPSEMCDSLLESETYQTASHLPFVPDIKHVEDAKDAFTEIEDGNIIKGGALALKTSVTTAMDVMIPSELICDPEGKSIGTRILDGSQLALDVAGCIPAVGNVADVVNAGISLLRGNKADAALSLACAIPFVGWGAAAIKILNKLPLKGLKKILKWLLDLLKRLGLGKMFVEFLAKNWKNLKELIGKGGAAVKRALAKGVKAFKGLGQKATKGFKKIGKGIDNLIEGGLKGFARGKGPDLPDYDGKTTHGVMVTSDGRSISFASGSPDPLYSNYVPSAHAEGKAALYMRENGIDSATIYHNNTNGTCGFCDSMLETLLPEGSTLNVVPPPNAIANNGKAVADPSSYTGNSKIPKPNPKIPKK